MYTEPVGVDNSETYKFCKLETIETSLSEYNNNKITLMILKNIQILYLYEPFQQ